MRRRWIALSRDCIAIRSTVQNTARLVNRFRSPGHSFQIMALKSESPTNGWTGRPARRQARAVGGISFLPPKESIYREEEEQCLTE
jgi:hypothetical protein